MRKAQNLQLPTFTAHGKPWMRWPPLSPNLQLFDPRPAQKPEYSETSILICYFYTRHCTKLCDITVYCIVFIVLHCLILDSTIIYYMIPRCNILLGGSWVQALLNPEGSEYTLLCYTLLCYILSFQNKFFSVIFRDITLHYIALHYFTLNLNHAATYFRRLLPAIILYSIIL